MRFQLDEQGPFLATEDSGVPALTDSASTLAGDCRVYVERDDAILLTIWRRLLRAGSSPRRRPPEGTCPGRGKPGGRRQAP